MEFPRALRIARRWTTGIVRVSWRYLWATTPLHRAEAAGDRSDAPPPLPEWFVDRRSQPVDTGVGPLFHRSFSVCIAGARLSPEELIDELVRDFNCVVPSEVTEAAPLAAGDGAAALGEDLVIRMPGPWDGPVRVVLRERSAFRFATLAGHLEAGQIEFRARRSGDGLRFVVEAWARPANQLVNLLYTRLRLAKEIQLNMWVRVCLASAELAGGKVRGGVTIRTRVLAWEPTD